MFTFTQNRWKIDDVLGVWPLHGLCGAWGGIAAGIFGSKALGGLGGVSFGAQSIGTALGIGVGAGRRLHRLRRAEAAVRHTSGRGTGIRRRGLEHPQDRRNAGARTWRLIRALPPPFNRLACFAAAQLVQEIADAPRVGAEIAAPDA